MRILNRTREPVRRVLSRGAAVSGTEEHRTIICCKEDIMNKSTRLSDIDHMYREARDALARERIRGILIGWYNDFRRLRRIIDQPPEGCDSETLPLLIGGVAMDCSGYQDSHLTIQNPVLREGLIPYEKKLTEIIYESAAAIRADAADIGDAIVCLAREHALGPVIDWLDSVTA